MLAIQNTIVSRDVIEKQFVCDLNKCKGACCVAGESGAPLDEAELNIIDDVFDKIEPYLTPRGRKALKKQGHYLMDGDSEWVTPLINEVEECAYTIYDDNKVAMCAFEKAYNEGVIPWRKPISCHLYPIRIKKLKDYDAVNYEKWSVCKPACKLGEQLQVPVYKFVKDALIRKYGQAWYDELCAVANEFLSEKEKAD